jgi:hypothetical protein
MATAYQSGGHRFKHDLPERLPSRDQRAHRFVRSAHFSETRKRKDVGTGITSRQFFSASMSHERRVVSLGITGRLELDPRGSVADEHQFGSGCGQVRVGLQEKLQVFLP